MAVDGIPQSEASRARDFITKLGKERGFVRKQFWDQLDEDGRAESQRITRSLQRELKPAVKALSQNSYGGTARFVLELLQNAENNNKFQHAKDRSERPYVSFYLSKDRLVVECNDDGFTTAHLRAICSTGQTSESSTNGIGFKSVFAAAWKVHIQSGNYSFYLQHRPSDSGLGMVTPIWEDPTEKMPRYLTRMTLDLHTDGDPESISAQRDSIRRQLGKLNGNVLLFMRKLKEIRIIVDENESQTSTVLSRIQADDGWTKIVKSVTVGDEGSPTTSSTIYHITKHGVHDLPKNENRSYSEEALRKQEYSTAEVILAFPLTPEHEPIVESQEVFVAPLAVEAAGFSFLIQSDFVTNTSRERIVTTSDRNVGLRDGICDAFIKAAVQFCSHKTLQYTWMKFLPDRRSRYNDFWSTLVTNIEEKARTTPLIRPESGTPLRLVTDVHNPRPSLVDKQDNLLLRDLTPELRISRHYSAPSITILEKLGLKGFYMPDFIRMVEQDLQSPDSWIKTRVSDDYLQPRVAYMLSYHCKHRGSSAVSVVQKLPIIPLQDGRWLAPAAGERVFFPDAAGLTIPEDVEFNLVHSSAAACSKRRELLKILGVEALSVGRVRERILERHNSYLGIPRPPQVLVQQLKFLYSTHDDSVNDKNEYSRVVLIDDSETPRMTSHHDVYLPDDNPPAVCNDSSTEEAPGFKVDFIHELYLQDVPKPPHQDSLPWRDWLVQVIGLEVMGVPRLLRLADMGSSPQDLVQACYYVARHRPEKFISFLAHHWMQEETPIVPSEEMRQKLRNIKVLCQGRRMLDLQDTFLPFPDLESQCAWFLAGKADFPFLQLEEPIERKDYSLNWASLADSLGISSTDDLAFYLRILLAFSTVQSPTEDDSQRVFELYKAIHGKYLQSTFKASEKPTIQASFNENRIILVPSGDGVDSIWAPLADCLWEAPPCLTSRYPLKARMERFLAESANLSSFFVDVLEIPNCDYSHIMRELEYLSNKGNSQMEIVSDLYRQLSAMMTDLPTETQEDIRSDFANKSLIYAENEGHGSWHQATQCMWGNEGELPGLTTLESHYKDLQDFFVDFLGVKDLSLELVYRELDRLGSSLDATRDQIEPYIWILNSYISAGSQPQDATTLLDRRIFPVRYPDGHVELGKAEVEFAIVDRAQLGEMFKPLVKTLDFDLDQVRRLGPTLNWLGLEARYLSEAVREISRVEGPSNEPLSAPERSIKPRAHALYRIAHHYNSPRLNEGAESLYTTLKNAQVYETDGIATTLSIEQDGQEISYEKDRSDLNIEEVEGQLNIFVPRDKRSQESCYARKLPRGLFKWLMTPSDGNRVTLDEKGLRIMASVLNSSRFVVPEILEDEGIAAGELEDDYEESPDPEEAQAFQAIEEPRAVDKTHVVQESHVVGDFANTSVEDPIATLALAETEAGETSVPSSPALIETIQYQSLLERVVTAARASPILPLEGAYELPAMSHTLPDLMGHTSYDRVYHIPPFWSSPQQERERRIGAAGELYVFELLKNMSPGLPGFSLENWGSPLWRYASAHPDYAEMRNWGHMEISDLGYNDREGAFTELLINNGYLRRDVWENKTPRYYLQVKTTTGPCEAPFFMSKGQYRLMQECRDSTEKVYIIFRVFEVDTAVQLRVYVNPAKLAESGHLINTETWSVRPGARDQTRLIT
ncbi:hypothetical protein ACHAPT_011164 [Fusarium lateritium]